MAVRYRATTGWWREIYLIMSAFNVCLVENDITMDLIVSIRSELNCQNSKYMKTYLFAYTFFNQASHSSLLIYFCFSHTGR